MFWWLQTWSPRWLTRVLNITMDGATRKLLAYCMFLTNKVTRPSFDIICLLRLCEVNTLNFYATVLKKQIECFLPSLHEQVMDLFRSSLT